MVWVRFDDRSDGDPALVRLSGSAFRAYFNGLVYIGRHLTDGRIPAEALTKRDRKCAPELQAAGLWSGSEDEGGWYAPRWNEHVPSAHTVERRRKAASERMRRHRASES